QYTAQYNPTTYVYTGTKITTTTALNDNFELTIMDATQGWTAVIDQSLGKNKVAARSSAEWIEEAPSSGGVLPWANFGSVTFSNLSATIGGSTQTNLFNFVGNPNVVNYGTKAAPREINIIDAGTTNRQGQWTSIS